MKRSFSIILLIILTASTLLYAKKAPDFTFKSFDDKEISLNDYKGKVVIVNFWATWCAPCIHEMPDLQKLYEKYQKDGLQILGLTVQSREKQIPKILERTGVTYPILLNAESAVQDYGPFNSIPQTFIINREGNIVEEITGPRTFKQFEKKIKELL